MVSKLLGHGSELIMAGVPGISWILRAFHPSNWG